EIAKIKATVAEATNYPVGAYSSIRGVANAPGVQTGRLEAADAAEQAKRLAATQRLQKMSAEANAADIAEQEAQAAKRAAAV
ncbi:hypothetical protein ACI3PL_28450, partial [Lacticaseibacillus paracasei]